MSEYRIRATGLTVTENELRNMFPFSTLPSPLTPEALEMAQADSVLETPKPVVTSHQTAYRDGVAQDTLGNWVYAWRIEDMAPEEAAVVDAQAAASARAAAKVKRTNDVAAIKVTTSAGHTFDGDEVSQGRMSRAIIALQAAQVPTINWTLSDNTVIQATVADLVEALILSGQAQAAIWVIS